MVVLYYPDVQFGDFQRNSRLRHQLMKQLSGFPRTVADLVETFDQHLEDYKKPEFNEAQLRQQFLDPLFQSLGWDVANEQGLAEFYKEVVHEDSIRIDGKKKAPDYCFRIGRERVFFVEAKKPKIAVETDKAAAYQLRRYAWSAKLPISVVTDFEEFAVYDTRIKPQRGDSAKVARIKYIKFTDYESEWPYLAELFSKTGVLRGGLRRYSTSQKRLRGTSTVDNEFLDELERWRSDLVKSFYRQNKSLSASELNYLSQITIDRILFLRICEDRAIEPYGALGALVKKKNIYRHLLELYRQAQHRYNAGLFHFSKEAGAVGFPDTLTKSVSVSDAVLKRILENLYFPKSPYEFSVFSADVLGQVYERFLGSRAEIQGKSVVVQLKPEVRKAGGVYYTPTHIVRFIIEATVTRKLGNTSTKLRPKIAILDMACGSGSFLIEAYQALLDWYLAWHIKNVPKSKKVLIKVPKASASGFDYHLSLDERKRILLDHIYGVDIDSQAVEVTKLSLLLKVLEDREIVPRQIEFADFKQRLLPDLSANIRCGNSIVGADFIEQQEIALSEEEALNVNAFDWDAESGFKDVLKSGGFDIVIGNPPYSYRNATLDQLKPYYRATYKCAQGNYDTYKFFLERALTLLKSGGLLGQIVNASFLIQPQFEKLRGILDSRLKIQQLDSLGTRAFEGVTIDTAIIVGEKRAKRPSKEDSKIAVREPEDPMQLEAAETYKISQKRFTKNAGHVFDWRLKDDEHRLVERVLSECSAARDYCEFSVGINTGAMKKEMIADRKIDDKYHPCVPGTGIARYGLVTTKDWIIYDSLFVRGFGARGRTLPPERFFTEDKILVVRTRNLSLNRRIVATLDEGQCYNLNRLSNIIAKDGTSILTMLGLLNSRFMNWLFQTRWYNYEIKPVYLKSIPVPVAMDDALEQLVTLRLALGREVDRPMSPLQQAKHKSKMEVLERSIDKRAFELYGLSKAEIAAVNSRQCD